MIDLRSDTVTRPTDAMRRAMAEAEVGDDVYHDDPTVNQLEETVAQLLGKDDAVYVPSGTMANQIALRSHTEPGDVVLASHGAHIDTHEGGAANAIAGLTVRWLPTERGTFTARAVRDAVPEPPQGMPAALFQPVRLVAAENTHNGAGGTVWPLDRLREVVAAAGELGLGTHLDGARLWNAAVASVEPESEIAAGFDTVSVCFSKGLGAPVGSALAGRRDLVERARRFKQMYGGGFRQAGVIAAAALYAVRHHRERLADDHDHARRLAAGLAEIPGLDVEPETVETNMLYFDTAAPADTIAERCHAAGVWMLPTGGRTIRAVTHLEISRQDVDRAIELVAKSLAEV